ncbi:tyrosine-type recombinase/integrase [Methylocystis sp. S23]
MTSFSGREGNLHRYGSRRANDQGVFGNLFREACDKAGLKHCSAHGLRKAAATRLAEAGATVPQLNAVFGWKGAKQALLYIEKADRARLARDAFAKRYVLPDKQ